MRLFLFRCTSLLILFVPTSASAQWWNVSNVDKPLITVGGEAVVYVTPDKCQVTLGVEQKRSDVSEAQVAVSGNAKTLLSAIKKFGIQDKDVQTEMISVSREYDYHESVSKHLARQTFTVTLQETEKVEAFITLSLKSGATTILGVDFQTSDLRKYRDQARQNAIQAAREKAELYAKEMGVSGLRPYSMQEVRTWEESWYGWWWGRRGGGMMQNSVVDARSGNSGSDGSGIPPGQLAIRAAVQTAFSHSNI